MLRGTHENISDKTGITEIVKKPEDLGSKVEKKKKQGFFSRLFKR